MRCPSQIYCCWLLSLAFVCLLQLPHAASNNHSGVIADAELSASERNRRLIPYMAFYLPAPELPINQQYAVKHAAAAGGSQLLAPAAKKPVPPSRIPVPVAYMPQTHPQTHPQQPQPPSHYQPHAADVYHALAIQHGGAPVRGKELGTPGATFIAYKPLSGGPKHKTVQHFPPLPQQELEQQQQREQEPYELQPPQLQLQPQFQRQRGKQSKINLTPFTAQNTLPGHFIPIIYTPLTKPNSNNNDNSNGNAINYSKTQQQQQQPVDIVYHKNAHQTQIVTDYAGDVPATPESPEQPAEPAVPSKPSVGYSVYSDPALVASAAASSSSAQSTKTALIVHQKSPAFGHVSKYESYFNMSPEQPLQQQSQQPQELTPQEKYVLYLQQRMKQQRLHQHQHQHHAHHHAHHHQQQLQPAQSNTKAGKHAHSHTPPTPPPQQPQTPHHSHIHNYNGFVVHPEVQQEQQVFNIPLRALMGPLHEQPKDALLGSPAPHQFIDYLIDGPRQSLEDDQQPQQQQSHQEVPTQRPQHAYILVTTAVPYTDHSAQDAPPTRTPLVYKQQPTLRLQPVSPGHKYHATRRPVYISPSTTSETVKITPKYVYVTSKPPLAEEEPQEQPQEQPRAPPPIKLRPVHKYAHERQPTQLPAPRDEDQLPDIRTSSLAEILHKLQASNHLPHTLTPDNIDNSIKTLIRILQNLKQTQTIEPDPPQHHEIKHSNPGADYDYNTSSGEEQQTPIKVAGHVDADLLHLKGPNKHPGPSTGRAGIDYPNYAEIPKTSFECTQQRYKGFFGDPETNCQVWHYCDLNGGKSSFLCPNGTIFSQIALTCDWWFNVKCSTTSQLYVLNERLYKYILPFNPKFPEDYNGPIVDKYLAMKFQEMEEKMRVEKQRKAKQQAEKPSAKDEASTPALPKNHKPSAKLGSGINAQVYEQSSERNLLIDDEIDDISERGTYDTYGQPPTTIMAPTTAASTGTGTGTAQDSETLGLRPIVVSSTPEPELSSVELDAQPESQQEVETEPEVDASESSQEADEEKLQSLRDTKETTKVSVEKLEVIEIKTDGTTGHLLPIDQARK